MRFLGLSKIFYAVVMVVVLMFAPVTRVIAQVPSSSNYSVPEASFSSGSGDGSSANFQSRGSVGNLGVGNAESANFQTFAGYITPDQEYVELVIPVTVVDMGVLEPGTPGTGTATFSARAYLNDNYIIASLRNPPTSGSSMIDPMTTAAPFDANTEQFGMNLVANTAPVNQGADPAPQPNAAFAYGQAAAGYDTANNYRYNAGDIIAESQTRGYGETIFTISYILNITSVTPAGQYTMEQDLVIMATF